MGHTTTGTTIATWGNSEAVRIPQAVLKAAGFKKGDRVLVKAAGQGRIELVQATFKKAHRHVVPTEHLTFEQLFQGYTGGRINDSDAWPDYAPTQAEKDVWSD